jgi:hypothetical protein
MSEVSKRRLLWTDGTEARETTQSEATSLTGHAGYQPKVAALV